MRIIRMEYTKTITIELLDNEPVPKTKNEIDKFLRYNKHGEGLGNYKNITTTIEKTDFEKAAEMLYAEFGDKDNTVTYQYNGYREFQATIPIQDDNRIISIISEYSMTNWVNLAILTKCEKLTHTEVIGEVDIEDLCEEVEKYLSKEAS